MSGASDTRDREIASPTYRSIARRIGVRLRDFYENPEAEGLPVEHVDLLLRLRHKEREQARRAG